MRGVAAALLLAVVAVAANDCPSDWLQDQLLPHEDCTKYYMCTNGEAEEMTCSDGLHFNVKTGHCDWPANANCEDTNVPGQNTTTTAVPETEPTTPETTTPTTKPPTTTPSTPKPDVSLDCSSDWLQDKLLPHEDCTKYYMCTDGEAEEMTCNDGLHFNVKTGHCDWPAIANCVPGQNTTTTAVPETEPTTPETTTPTTKPPTTTPSTPKPDVSLDCPSDWLQDKLLPHEDCTKYYMCTDGEAEEMTCNDGLHFNVKTGHCDWPAIANCVPGQNTTTTAVPETEPTTPETTTPTTKPPTTTPSTPKPDVSLDCPSDWLQDKLLPHEDCTKYYMCTDGEAEEMTCNDGLHFNVKTGHCNWPAIANCVPGQNTTTTAVPETEPTTPETTTPTTKPPTTTPSTPKPDVSLDCPSDWLQDKLLPHEDCTKYYMCTYGEAEEMTCNDGLHFNVKTGHCDWPAIANCVPGQNTTTTAVPETEPTTPEPTTPTTKPTTTAPSTPKPGFLENGCPVNPHIHWHLPVEGDCNGFYQCVWGELALMACPSTLHFNRYKQVCDWPAHAGCEDRNVPRQNTTTTRKPTTSKPTTAAPPTPPTDFLPNGCPVDPHIHWHLPVEGDCNGFYYCVWGELVLMACPSNLHFNRTIQVCDWPENAGCEYRNTTTPVPETEPTTPEPTTPEPTTPQPTTPETTTPEPTTPTTKPTTAAPTTPRPTTATPTIPPTDFLENGCPVNPHIHWLLPVEGDCNGFYQCVWGEVVLMACPSTLHFNKIMQVCDWPRDAGCAATLNKHDFRQYSQRY